MITLTFTNQIHLSIHAIRMQNKNSYHFKRQVKSNKLERNKNNHKELHPVNSSSCSKYPIEPNPSFLTLPKHLPKQPFKQLQRHRRPPLSPLLPLDN